MLERRRSPQQGSESTAVEVAAVMVVVSAAQFVAPVGWGAAMLSIDFQVHLTRSESPSIADIGLTLSAAFTVSGAVRSSDWLRIRNVL